MARHHKEKIQIEKEKYEWSIFLSPKSTIPTIDPHQEQLPFQNTESRTRFNGNTIYHLSGLEEPEWAKIRKVAFHRNYDCDRSLDCNKPRSGQYCFTKQYSSCPNYRFATREQITSLS